MKKIAKWSMIYNINETNRELKWKIMDQQTKIDIMQTKIDRLNELISNCKDNLDYLVEKGVLSGPLNESLVAAMKLGINLRENNFLASISEIDDYFTK